MSHAAAVRAMFLLMILLGLALLMGSGQGADAQTDERWSTPVNLSESSTASYYPDVTVDSAGHVYVVWGEFSKDQGGWPDQLMFRMWDGQTWSPANDIALWGHLPQIGVDSQGRLHLLRVTQGVWPNPGWALSYTHVWAQENPSAAQTWTPDRNVGIYHPYWPAMIIDSQDRIHVVFTDAPNYGEERAVDEKNLCITNCEGIFYTHSVDGGVSWSEPIQLDTPHTDAGAPRLAVDGHANVYAIWPDVDANETVPHFETISFSYSADGGVTWSTPSQIATGDVGHGQAQVAVDSAGTVYVVWRYAQSVGAGNVAYVTSSDRGENWSPVQILPVASDGAYSFGLAVDSADNLHLVMPAGATVLQFVCPPGGQWSAPTAISENPCSAASADAELVVSQGNHLHAVWYERLECELGFVEPSGRGEVFYSDSISDAPVIVPEPLPLVPTPTAATAADRSTSSPEATAFTTPRVTATPTVVDGLNTKTYASTPVSGLVVGIGATGLVMVIAAGAIVGMRRR